MKNSTFFVICLAIMAMWLTFPMGTDLPEVERGRVRYGAPGLARPLVPVIRSAASETSDALRPITSPYSLFKVFNLSFMIISIGLLSLSILVAIVGNFLRKRKLRILGAWMILPYLCFGIAAVLREPDPYYEPQPLPAYYLVLASMVALIVCAHLVKDNKEEPIVFFDKLFKINRKE